MNKMKWIPDRERNDVMWEAFLEIVGAGAREAFERSRLSATDIANISQHMDTAFATRSADEVQVMVNNAIFSRITPGETVDRRLLGASAFFAAFGISLHARAPRVREWVEACVSLHFPKHTLFDMLLEGKFGITTRYIECGPPYDRARSAFNHYLETFRESEMKSFHERNR